MCQQPKEPRHHWRGFFSPVFRRIGLQVDRLQFVVRLFSCPAQSRRRNGYAFLIDLRRNGYGWRLAVASAGRYRTQKRVRIGLWRPIARGRFPSIFAWLGWESPASCPRRIGYAAKARRIRSAASYGVAEMGTVSAAGDVGGVDARAETGTVAQGAGDVSVPSGTAGRQRSAETGTQRIPRFDSVYVESEYWLLSKANAIVGLVLQADALRPQFAQNWVRTWHLLALESPQKWVRFPAAQQNAANSQNWVRRRNWYATRLGGFEPAQRRNRYALSRLARRIGYASTGWKPHGAPISAGITRLFTAPPRRETAVGYGSRRNRYAFCPSRCGKACGISELSPQNPVRCFR